MNRSVIEHLNAELATAFVLALNAKRYHWTVTGPHFRDYHLRFEDLYTAADRADWYRLFKHAQLPPWCVGEAVAA